MAGRWCGVPGECLEGAAASHGAREWWGEWAGERGSLPASPSPRSVPWKCAGREGEAWRLGCCVLGGTALLSPVFVGLRIQSACVPPSEPCQTAGPPSKSPWASGAGVQGPSRPAARRRLASQRCGDRAMLLQPGRGRLCGWHTDRPITRLPGGEAGVRERAGGCGNAGGCRVPLSSERRQTRGYVYFRLSGLPDL